MSQEELVSNFAINYLKKRGYTEEDILDESGDMKPELQDHIKKLILKKDPEQLFSDYESDPDGTIDQIISDEDNEITSMKKGGYLLKLKKGKTLVKKCGCGCNMIEAKAEGGTMVSKCACNCKGGKVAKKESGGLIQKLQQGKAVVNPAITDWVNKPLYQGRSGAVINPNLNPLAPVADYFQKRVNETRVSTQGAGTATQSFNQLGPFRSQGIGRRLHETGSGTQAIGYGTDPSILNNIFGNAGGPSTQDLLTNVPSGTPIQNKTTVASSPYKPIAGTPVPPYDSGKLTNPGIYHPIEIAEGKAITKTKETAKAPGIANPNISIVDYLKSVGVADTSQGSRKSIAEKFGIADYKGTAEQNLELIRRLKTREDAATYTQPMAAISGIRPVAFKVQPMSPVLAGLTARTPQLMKKGGNFIKQAQIKPEAKQGIVPNFGTKKSEITEKGKKTKPNFKVKPKK